MSDSNKTTDGVWERSESDMNIIKEWEAECLPNRFTLSGFLININCKSAETNRVAGTNTSESVATMTNFTNKVTDPSQGGWGPYSILVTYLSLLRGIYLGSRSKKTSSM